MSSVAVDGERLPGLEDHVASRGLAPLYRLGRYHVIAELARSGMGVVYLALARGPGAFHELIVLKELKPELHADPFEGLFMEEASLAACLSHPNVVRTIETGSDGDRRYIAMEYLEGQPLHRVVSRARRQGSPASFAWQTSVLCCAIEGLAYAHSARDADGRPLGIVHRDMSPHNVMVGYDGHVKVLDFGIAKATADPRETQSGLVRSKVSYMSPEQAAGLPPDRSSDVFAVGVMLWEAATGRRFWAGLDNDNAILHALYCGQLGTSRDRSMAEIPGQLQHVIARATAARPEDRYESATALLTELRGALASCGVPVLGADEIGKLTRELFAEDRVTLQASIDRALTIARRPSAGVRTTISSDGIPAVRGTPSQPPEWQPALELVDLGWDDPADDEEASPPLSEPTAPPPLSPTTAKARGRVRAPRRAAGAAMIVGVMATAAALVAGPRPAPGGSRLLVRASPANARIEIDGRMLPGNPYAMTLRRDGASHTVVTVAEGFVRREDRFDATGDMTLVIALERSEADHAR